ncbi:hypothetical protein D3C72_2151490 [compost metagenome]
MLLGRRVKDDYLPDWILTWMQAYPDDAHVAGGTDSPATLLQSSFGRDPCGGVQTVAAGSAIQMASLLR